MLRSEKASPRGTDSPDTGEVARSARGEQLSAKRTDEGQTFRDCPVTSGRDNVAPHLACGHLPPEGEGITRWYTRRAFRIPISRGRGRRMDRRRLYLQNAALLTGSGLVLRALGMGFRVVLAAYLGSEGMGLYQLILALYMVFVSFATAGINVASARLAAQSLARGSGMAETLRGLCFTALGFGTAAMLAQSILAAPCARYLLHDVRAESALLILAPSLPFMAVSGGGAGVLPRRTAGAAEHHSAAHRAAGADGRRRGGAASAGAVGRGVRLRRRAAGQHSQRGRLLRHHAGVCRPHAGISRPPRRAAAPLHPQGAVRHPVAGRGQPHAGKRTAGRREQPDPLHADAVHRQPRRGDGAVRQPEGHGAAAVVFPVFRCWGRCPAC